MKNLDFNVIAHLIFDFFLLIFFGVVVWREPSVLNTIFSFVGILVAFWSPSPIQLSQNTPAPLTATLLTAPPVTPLQGGATK